MTIELNDEELCNLINALSYGAKYCNSMKNRRELVKEVKERFAKTEEFCNDLRERLS